MSVPPDKISELLHSMQSCISDVNVWATANTLKHNDKMSELMLFTSKIIKHLHNLFTSITIGNAQLPFRHSVKKLGFTLDSHLTFNAHVSNMLRHATVNCVVWHLSNVGFGYRGRRFEPRQQYVVSLSKTLYPHCFSRLSCEMSTRWEQPREGCSVL